MCADDLGTLPPGRLSVGLSSTVNVHCLLLFYIATGASNVFPAESIVKHTSPDSSVVITKVSEV